MTARTYPKPTPETIELNAPYYVFSTGLYGHRGEWVARRVTLAKVLADGQRLAVTLGESAIKSTVPMRWSVSRDAYLVASRMMPVAGEMRYPHDPDVILARKYAVGRWLRRESATRGDIYGNPEDPNAYVERMREAATKAGTRLLRIEEGL